MVQEVIALLWLLESCPCCFEDSITDACYATLEEEDCTDLEEEDDSVDVIIRLLLLPLVAVQSMRDKLGVE